MKHGPDLQKLILATILAGIPGLFLFFLIERIDATTARQEQREEIEQMRQVLSRTADLANLQRKFGDLLTRLSYRTRFKATAANFVQSVARVQASHRRVLDLYLFGPDGTRKTIPGIPDAMVFASRKFLEAIHDADAKVPAKLIAGFAGKPDAANAIRKLPSTLVDLFNGDHQTWGGWWPLFDPHGRHEGDLIAFVHRGAVSSDALFDQAVKDANRRVADRFCCGWLDPLAPAILRPLPTAFPPGLAEAIASMPIGETGTTFGGRSLAIHTAGEGEFLFALGASAFSGTRRLGPWRGWLLPLFFLGGWLISGRLLQSSSLRTRLVWILLISASFPLAVFLTAVLLDRQATEENLVRRIRESQLERLIRIDGEMHSLLLPTLKTYLSFEKTIPPFLFSDLPLPGKMLREASASSKGLIKAASVIDERGRRRFSETFHAAMGRSIILGKEIPVYAKNILGAVNGEVLIGSDSTGMRKNPISEMLVTTKHPWTWFEDLGSLWNTVMGKNEELIYFRLFPGRRLDFGGILMVFHDFQLAQKRYLRQVSRESARDRSRDPDLPVFLAVSVAPSPDLPAFPSPATERHQVIRAFRDRILATDLPCHQVSTIRGRPYLLSGLRGRLPHDYVLMLAQPLNAIQRETAATTLRAGVLALFGLLLAGGTAWTASRWLLSPLESIERGLVALRNRDFQATVPPGRIDELAQVADRLNRTIDGLRDLELAKTVQEHLWPPHGLSGKGWRIDGRCVTASDLGGDHHDWFELPDGKIVIALGDVAGHGIPSGLVAASAKVSLALYAQSEGSPEQILLGMNRVVQEQIGRTRPMTFWLGLFDPSTRRLSYANAGQCYPILLVPAEQPRMLESPGMPLGSVKRPRFSHGEIDLRSGGRLCIYSDGLIEAIDGQGRMFGYPAMTECLQHLSQESGAVTLASVFDLVRRHSGKAIPDDDQTMVVLDLDPMP